MISRKIVLILSVLLAILSLMARELRINRGGSNINFVDVVSLVIVLLGVMAAIFYKHLAIRQNQVPK